MAEKEFTLKIGPKGEDDLVVYNFTLPKAYYNRFYHVSFDMTSSELANVSITPGNMVYVRERFYHRWWAWLAMKFKGERIPCA